MAPAHQTASELPQSDRFLVQRQLGAGNFGIVYQALDRDLGTTVALKLLPHASPQALYRFKREFRSLVEIVHPNLVRLYELFAQRDRWFFTMELIDGVDFLAYTRPEAPGGRLPEAQGRGAEDYHTASTTDDCPPTETSASDSLFTPASTFDADMSTIFLQKDFDRLRDALRQLAQGLCVLHDAGKVHRDVKPSNVLVTREGRVVLLDFGLAIDLDEHGAESMEHFIAGTVPYMSPEQGEGATISPVSDWYSVGVMLFQVLTGHLPFRGTFPEVRRAKSQSEPPAPRELVPSIPEDLNALCMDLLRRIPESRLSGREVIDRLGSTSGEPSCSVPRAFSRLDVAPFVGREQQLAVLTEAFSLVQQKKAVTVLIQGRSGMGKSALVQRFLEILPARDDAVVLSGRCYERESVPYKALDSLADALSRYLKRLDRHSADALMPRDVQALTRVFPVLGRADAVARAPGRITESEDQQDLRRRAFAALRELLARLGDRRPLVLYIDDLQWGDVDSAGLLLDLLRPPDPPALMLLGSYRSEDATTSPFLRAFLERRDKVESAPDRREINLEPLTQEEARKLAISLLQDAGSETEVQAETIAQQSGGNPFFVSELVHFVQSSTSSRTRPLAAGEVKLGEVIWTRITQLPNEARRLLEVVVVAGRPIGLIDACRAAELASDDRTALALLQAAKLVRTTGAPPHGEAETFHDHIREIAVARMPDEELRKCHHRLARVLEDSGRTDPAVLALHCVEALEHDRAAEYFARAASEAAANLAFDRAVNLYRAALKYCPAQSDKHTLQIKLGDALGNAGRGAEGAREYLAASINASKQEMAELQRRAALQYFYSGHVDEGFAALRTGLSAVGMKLPVTERGALLSLLFRRAQIWCRGTSFVETDASLVPNEQLQLIDICWSVAIGLGLIDPIRGADYQARGLLLALRAGEPYRIARSLAMEAGHVATAGGPAQKRVERLLNAAETLAQRVANPYALGMATFERGLAAFLQGQWTQAVAYFNRAEGIFGDPASRDPSTSLFFSALHTSQHFALLAQCYRGQIAQVSQRCPDLLKEAEDRADRFAVTNLSMLPMMFVRLAKDDSEGALRLVHEAIHQWSRKGFYLQHHFGLMAETMIYLYSGEIHRAWKIISEHWPCYAGSMLWRVQYVRIDMLQLRARVAIAAAAIAANPRSLLKRAESDVRRMRRERMPWGQALTHLVEAGIAAVRRDSASTIALLRRAVTALDAVDMHLHAAAARHRLGSTIGGDEGRAIVTAARASIHEQGFQNVDRTVSMILPGFAT